MSGIATLRDRTKTTAAAPLYRRGIAHEVLFVGLGYLVYSQVRGMAGDRVSEAYANAQRLISLEESLGIFHELTFQSWVLSSDLMVDFFNFIYFYMFFPLVIPSAIFFYLKRPNVYVVARNAFLISGGIALFFFLTLPMAPPRLIGMGFVDTLNNSLAPTYSSIPGVNEYAALPSMHVGWNFLLATALYLSFPAFRLRFLFFLLPVAMFTATIATGNHYFLDGVLGLIVAGAALMLALSIQKTAEKRGLARQLQAPSST
jgi:hypothetical protein